MVQKDDQLLLRNFDVNSKGGPGFIVVKSRFEDVLEAPNTSYKPNEAVLRPGKVFVHKCYDGVHFAKMEVLEIEDEIESD